MARQPKQRWTWKLWLVLAAVATAAAVAVVASRPAHSVLVVHPQRASLQAYVEEQAVSELARDHLISMPINGWLEPILLREGDPVTAAQVVATLETADLEDRVMQAQQRIAVLETDIRSTEDHRLEQHMLEETRGVVQAMHDTVQAAEAQLEGSLAIFEFAQKEVERIGKLSESDSAAERELRAAKTELRKSSADYRSNMLQLASLRTLATISKLGPQFMTDYIDRKSFEVETLRRQLAEACAQLEIERRNLTRTQVRSPIDGLVLSRLQTRRQYLSAGTPLLTLGQLEDMEVMAEVLTDRAMAIDAQDAVEVVGLESSEPVTGRVLRVYPAGFRKISSLGVEQQRVRVAIKLDRRPERLGVGYRLRVRIIHDVALDALTVPRTSLFRDVQERWQVLVVRAGRVALQGVEVGLINDDRAQILRGLDASDAVILHPSSELEDGMRVSAPPPEAL